MDVVEIVTSGVVGGAVAWVVAKFQLGHTERLAAKDRIYHAWLDLAPALSGASGPYLSYLEFETLKLGIGRFLVAVGGREAPLGVVASEVLAAGDAARSISRTEDYIARMAGRDPDAEPASTDEERNRRRLRDETDSRFRSAIAALTDAAIAAARINVDD